MSELRGKIRGRGGSSVTTCTGPAEIPFDIDRSGGRKVWLISFFFRKPLPIDMVKRRVPRGFRMESGLDWGTYSLSSFFPDSVPSAITAGALSVRECCAGLLEVRAVVAVVHC